MCPYKLIQLKFVRTASGGQFKIVTHRCGDTIICDRCWDKCTGQEAR